MSPDPGLSRVPDRITGTCIAMLAIDTPAAATTARDVQTARAGALRIATEWAPLTALVVLAILRTQAGTRLDPRSGE